MRGDAPGRTTYTDGDFTPILPAILDSAFIGQFTVTWDGIENYRPGFRKDTLVGDGNANVLIGGNDDDTLRGGGGNDKLYGDYRVLPELAVLEERGFGGSDTIYGDAGDDVITVLWGNDKVHGGDDIDTLAFTEVRAGLTLDLA